MVIKYNEIEKIWSAPESEVGEKWNSCSLGEAILTKLHEDNPERVLEVFYDMGIQLTVGDILRQTITVAQNFQRLGLRKGDTVLLYSVSNEKVTPIVFACYTIGAPINFFETKLEGGDISTIIQQVDPAIIIFEEKYRSRLFKALESINLQNLKHVLSLGSEAPSVDEVLFAACGAIESFQIPTIENPMTHPATLMLTSGTTGLPKIILHSHSFMIRGIFSWWQLKSSDRVFCFSPLRWISQVSMMLNPVFYECQRFYTSQDPSGPLGKHIIETCKITHFFTTPAMYSAILKASENSSSSLSSMKRALVGGEVVTDALLDDMLRLMPKCRPLHSYGMTEFAGLVASDEGIDRKKCANGMALRNGFMAKFIDENNKPLGPNKMGRLCMKRTSLPYLKYLKNDKANRESFLEGGWLNTGDYGFMDSMNMLHIVMRYKDLVRSEGNIIIPSEVEKKLESHPSVSLAVLAGHPNPNKPNDEIATVFVVLKNGSISTNIQNDLQEFMKTNCTKEEVKAVRHFKVVSNMPLTSCGKIDRNALQIMASKACK
ncbi:2-succinylbenzoate--CoA ligase-like [Eupeodes corollae]|uniref:2-succinylbenzoate--CoA ligase-like n=1 Tax=Eupeodes corollae TaxID=290404 RepID=UPI00249021CF|nr:2-succinylbenzoate--CoA ligase-like [Eupeodes corollae]